MGCSFGTDVGFDAFSNTEEFQNYEHEFKLLDLSTAEIRRLYLAFDSITCGLKSMPVDELLESVGLPRTLFAEKLFLILSVSKSREIDFRLFVLCVWNFCTLTRLNMDMFVYDMYDNNGTKPLLPIEVSYIVEDLFDKEQMTSNVQIRSAVVDLEELQTREKSFNRDKFHKFMDKYKAILFPAFQIQRALQSKVCGGAFWQKLAERRAAMSPDAAYVSIAELLDSDKTALHCGGEPTRRVSFGDASPSPGMSSKRKRLSNKVHVDNLSSGTGTPTAAAGELPPLSTVRRSSSTQTLSTRVSNGDLSGQADSPAPSILDPPARSSPRVTKRRTRTTDSPSPSVSSRKSLHTSR